MAQVWRVGFECTSISTSRSTQVKMKQPQPGGQGTAAAPAVPNHQRPSTCGVLSSQPTVSPFHPSPCPCAPAAAWQQRRRLAAAPAPWPPGPPGPSAASRTKGANRGASPSSDDSLLGPAAADAPAPWAAAPQAWAPAPGPQPGGGTVTAQDLGADGEGGQEINLNIVAAPDSVQASREAACSVPGVV